MKSVACRRHRAAKDDIFSDSGGSV